MQKLVALGLLALGFAACDPIHDLARQGDVEGVERALEAGADINTREDFTGVTPLIAAARAADDVLVARLLELGADPLIGNKDGYTAVDIAAYHAYNGVLALLLAHSPNVAAHRHAVDGHSPFHRVMWGRTKAHVRAAEQFLRVLPADLAVDVVSPDAQEWDLEQHGTTLLMLASQEGNEELVRLLLAHGAALGAKDAHGQTALHRAARKAQEHTVRALLDAGANMWAKDNEGRTPRDVAPQSGVKRLPLRVFDEYAAHAEL